MSKRKGSGYGYVYFLYCEATGLVKIGFTGNVRNRASAIRSSVGVDLALLVAYPATLGDEAALHERFADLWSNGEWFRAENLLLAYASDCRLRSDAFWWDGLAPSNKLSKRNIPLLEYVNFGGCLPKPRTHISASQSADLARRWQRAVGFESKKSSRFLDIALDEWQRCIDGEVHVPYTHWPWMLELLLDRQGTE